MRSRVVSGIAGVAVLFLIAAIAVLSVRQQPVTGAPPETHLTPGPVKPTFPPPPPTPTYVALPTSTPATHPTVIPPDTSPGAQWRSFTNTAGGYRFHYPPDWYVSPGGPNTSLYSYDPLSTTAQGPAGTHIKIDIIRESKAPSESLEQRLDANLRPVMDRVIDRRQISVGGRAAVRQVIEFSDPPGSPPRTGVAYWVDGGDAVYSLWPLPFDSRQIGRFEQLLATFELVK